MKGVVYLQPALREALGPEANFEAIMRIEGEVFRDLQNRRTSRFSRGGRSYFIKQHEGVGWREIVKNLLQLRLPIVGAATEYAAIQRLSELGVPTMTIAGYGSRGRNPARRRSFLITEDLGEMVSLEEVAERERLAPTEKRRLIRRVADIARTLHENGVNHRDFYICHFLWNRRAPDPEPRLHVIDLHRSQLRTRTPRRWIVKDVGSLYFSAMDAGLTRGDRLRFIARYSGKPLRRALVEDARFWEDVRRRAVHLYYHRRG